MRLLLVISSLSPLFILWAILGFGGVDAVEIFPEFYFRIGCVLLATVPTLILLQRVYIARKNSDIQELFVDAAEDHRSHLLLYLFAMLLPFYQQEIDSYRDLMATLFMLSFIVFLFWHFNLHYLNIYFAIFNYWLITVSVQSNDNADSRRYDVVIFTLHHDFPPRNRFVAYQLSKSVFLEKRKDARLQI